MCLKNFFKASHFNKPLIILAVALVLVFVFGAGVLVGHEKERFSNRWDKNYYRNMMGPGRGGLMGLWGRPNFNGHSGLGQIIKIDGNSLIVKDQSNVEKMILINGQTAIIKDFQSLKAADLKIDDRVVVFGRPNDQGQIEAKLIRVMPGQPPLTPNQR